ncbi:MAG: arylesterase [Gammaproteobacteria bacterium]|nr:arylesterase [Gammaproteobacteria bacterium]
MCVPAYAATILVVGDSLSAGYGLHDDEGWVHLLALRLNQSPIKHHVINASISGDTTAGGVSRITAALRTHQPTVVVIALGANDGLRGLSLADMKKNLEQIITQCQKQKARVVLVGMRLPPNYGQDYTRAFEKVYTQLAQRYRLAFVPFLLQGLENNKNAFQADQLHPVAAVQGRVLDNVWHALKPLL